MSYDPTVILPFGARVRLVEIDQYGLLGRDPHPQKEDLGFTGVVVSNTVENDDDVDHDVKPGTGLPEEALVIYSVRAPDGKQFDLASYEVEVVS